MTDNQIENITGTTEQVDEKRRSAVLTMANVLTYAPPVIATFAMGGMSVREAHAYGGQGA